jgi:hypothetical protein
MTEDIGIAAKEPLINEGGDAGTCKWQDFLAWAAGKFDFCARSRGEGALLQSLIVGF